MIDLPPIVLDPPPAVDRAEWERWSAGERLRWLKAHQHELKLTRDQYLQLSRVPYWAAYGPEHGLPAELFNQQGFLRPKYRPGGGLEDEFQWCRKCYRLASWRRLRLQRWLERSWQGSGAFVLVAWLMLGFLLATLFAQTHEERFAGVSEEVLAGGFVIAYCLASGVLAVIALAVVMRCIVRGSIRAVGGLEQATPGEE